MAGSERAGSVRIRRAAATDAPGVSLLFDAYRQFYQQAADIDLCRNYITERLQRGDSVILLAMHEGGSAGDGQPLGFCQMYPGFCSILARPIYTLYDLFVSPQARGRGAGRALLDEAEVHARAQGMARLDLTTAKTNATAQALYESQGWLRDDEFFTYTRTLTAA